MGGLLTAGGVTPGGQAAPPGSPSSASWVYAIDWKESR